jgi:ubiquinone/menaquinone biosynthesis C-methylase UbiE
MNRERMNKMVTFKQMPAILSEDCSSLCVTSPSSLVRYRMIGTSSQGYTYHGKKAARLLYKALSDKKAESAKVAQVAYLNLIPKERIGDEYTAFEWICRYLIASKEEQTQMTSYFLDTEYMERLGSDDYAFLKTYLRIKYDLDQPDPELQDGIEYSKKVNEIVYEYTGKEVSFDQLNDWSEFVSFNNPNRQSWEKTDEMLDYLNIREGEAVADVGCGFGFFTFKFSQMVGKSGKIYSTEINKEALSYVNQMNEKYKLNTEVLEAKLNDACLPSNSVNTIFLCSMYHAVYIASIEFVKDQFIESLKKALKEGGRLIVVDNDITPPTAIPYFGSGIAKELVITQLKQYGFRLLESKQFIPQRYILIFSKDEF